GQQYLYVCARCSAVVEPFVLPAIAAIDLADVGQRIGDRAKPLAPRTMARIQWGLDNLVSPIVATVAGNTYEAGAYRRAWPAGTAPLTTRQATGCDAVVGPVIVNSNHDDDRMFLAETAPLPTRTVRIGDGVATPPLLIDSQTTGLERRVLPSADAPIGAVMAGGNRYGMASLPMVVPNRNHGRARLAHEEPAATVATGNSQDVVYAPFVVKNYGGNARPSHLAAPISDPLSPITTKDHHALVIPYRRTNRPHGVGEPLNTMSTKPSDGLLHAAVPIEDCHYRMLKPREHARAQRFYDDYVITGNIGEQTMQAGNAVPCNVAQWIGRQLAAVLA
ncbi:MAG: DNA cytosine methyltransferase, partial [Actinobacteria bacterium]|nr:DNA cytosine methyltransferase [Actinomycetota bacterium]